MNANKLQFNLSKVSSSDYWLFRKTNNNVTHQAYVQNEVVKIFVKAKNFTPTSDQIWQEIVKKWDNKATSELPAGDTNKQCLQYLGQLTDKGFNRLINAIRLTVTMAKP